MPQTVRPRFGVVLPTSLSSNYRHVVNFCELAEDLGFDRTWINDVAAGPELFDLMAFAAAQRQIVRRSDSG